MTSENKVSRYQLYVERTEKAQKALFDDIDSWKKTIDGNKSHLNIQTHIQQFEKFCTDILSQLSAQHGGKSEDEVVLRSKVIGVLTGQWRNLRQVAEQRLPENPYQGDLAELDKEAANYYSIVRNYLPEKFREQVAESTPIVYFGDAANLTFFNNPETQAPSIISAPFGVRSDKPNSRNRLSIAHETGHAIFERIPNFHTQLRSGIDEQLRYKPSMQATFATVKEWINEIVADLVGVALAGVDFGESSLMAMAMPRQLISYTDETHPIPIIRPYVSLVFLQYLQNHLKGELEKLSEKVSNLEVKFDDYSGSYLDEPVNVMPFLAKATLRDVKEALIAVTNLILECDLEGKTFGEILIECYLNNENVGADEPRVGIWGKFFIDGDFALDLSYLEAPEYAVPVAFPDLICIFLPFLPSC